MTPEGVAEVIDEGAYCAAALAEHHSAKPNWHRDEQHLQDVALGKGADAGLSG
jgi:hypothetical protein